MLPHLASPSECLSRDSPPNVTLPSELWLLKTNLSSRVEGSDGGDGGSGLTPYLWITCILATLNAITNGFSLIVFALDRKNVSMRRLLLLLSLSETVLNVCMSINLGVMLSIGRERRYSSFPNVITGLFFLSFMLFNGYIMIRNWCLVMIAGSRCEAVRNPLSTRSGQLFNPSRTLLGYGLLSLVSLGVYTPRLFEFTWIVYQLPCNASVNINDSNSVAMEYLLTTRLHHILDALPAYGYYKTMLLYPLQTILPIFLIAALSFLIVLTLRRREIQQQHQQQHRQQSVARVSQDAATKTVMVLMLAFIVCELPTFVFFVLNRTVFKALANYEEVRTHTTFIGNILVCLDSFSNFIIYSSTSNSFRQTVRRIFRLADDEKFRRRRQAGVQNYLALRACDPRFNRNSIVNAPLAIPAAAMETNAV